MSKQKTFYCGKNAKNNKEKAEAKLKKEAEVTTKKKEVIKNG